MRKSATSGNGKFTARAISGTRAILIAINCDEKHRQGLLGFSFHRTAEGETTGKWLRSQKVFKSLVPDPKAEVHGKRPVFTTEVHPVQDFTWSDYTPDPGKRYIFRILPRYGHPGAMTTDEKDIIDLPVITEVEDDPKGHGVWFNRGAIAGQHFAKEFNNAKPTTAQLEDITQPVTKWLSRDLVEACLGFINDIPQGEGLRACFYEFTYKPVIVALKAAVDRGVDVRIAYHDTDANNNALKAAGLPKKSGGRQVLYPRTVPKIPHNKFMIRLDAGEPVSIWTGSTNITPSGFLGQTNVGHKLYNPDVAGKYLKYWQEIMKDPQAPDAKAASTKITPHPRELIPPNSVVPLFSPRHTSRMLDWYANRMGDASELVMFTAAFGVSKEFVEPLARERDFLRYILMENRPKKELNDNLRKDRDVMISYGAVLGETNAYDGKKFKKVRIKKFGLDEWFEQEEHFRKSGNIFYVHTKFLLIDPLSEDPLVCTGSANFSANSLTGNDENMLLIRGDTRVADIYFTEFDRIFRHFYFRDVANEIEMKGGKAQGAFLWENNKWTDAFFKNGRFRTRRREMFFAKPAAGWAAAAAQRPADETARQGDIAKGGKKAAAKKKPAAKKAAKKAVKKPVAKKKSATKKKAAKK